MNSRYFTKSKFILAMECPTKIYYSDKDEYSNLKTHDSFLEGLAENGYQVSALARCYHPEGILVDEKSNDEAIKKTNELLKNENVTIFEGAFRFKNIFLRSDIIVKNGSSIKLIEVKSKSYDSFDKSPFMIKTGEISSKWKPYIHDIAFQKYVLMKSLPEINITSYLMLADINSKCPTDGMNQKFRIIKDGEIIKVSISEMLSDHEIGNKILKTVNVDNEINHVYIKEKYNNMSFQEYINFLSDCYIKDVKIKPVPGSVCKKCEFKSADNYGLKSGFFECWNESFSFHEQDCKSPMILDIWNLKSLNKLIRNGVCRVNKIYECDINIKNDGSPGLSASERQWLQIKKMKNNDNEMYIDNKGLMDTMASWNFPLHFIDFETIKPAIPFNKNERPYYDLAFQFSHHIMYADGKVEHAGQYINKIVGKNPNLDFIRALKNSLNNDNGTIFRYASHENTYLNKIYFQIIESEECISDKEEITYFIKSISKSTRDSKEKWEGERNMVDLRELVLRFYFDPLTFGSNSIKDVFPAILNRSRLLQEKYSLPIYGAPHGIPSLNFSNMRWVQKENGRILDPYSLLPKLFQDIDISDKELNLLFSDDVIKGGGTASIAYARLQFFEMTEIERQELITALLKYCELDTLAMVMIVEAWRNILKMDQNFTK